VSRRVAALAAALLLVAAAGCGALPGGAENGGPDEPVRENESYFSFDGERLTLESTADQSIAGHVNESRDIETVAVRLQSTDTKSPFLRSATANVSESGTFETAFNFSNVDGGAGFTATLLHNGTTLAEADGEVVNATA